MTRAILVAGGAGYIGSHVCKLLAASGYLPITLDNLSTGHRKLVRFGPLAESSVSDVKLVRKLVKGYRIKAVIDLAGFIDIAESVRDPIKYYQNNFLEKRIFLETLWSCGVRAFVFASTASVYGDHQPTPVTEAHPLHPANPYGWSKRIFEQALQGTHMRYMILRYFNAAGASPDGDIGECHEPETHLIPNACAVALGRKPALQIFGNDYDTEDGTAVRDYVHVMDLASAHVFAVEALLSGAPSAVYNLGNGKGFSVMQVLKAFSELGLRVPHYFAPRRAGDPAMLVADATAAKKNLGWTPRHTEITTIIESAYHWHKGHTFAHLSHTPLPQTGEDSPYAAGAA
jgi:UDP-glucose 4-epimerase/UDP-arabinose 4-epimerase